MGLRHFMVVMLAVAGFAITGPMARIGKTAVISNQPAKQTQRILDERLTTRKGRYPAGFA